MKSTIKLLTIGLLTLSVAGLTSCSPKVTTPVAPTYHVLNLALTENAQANRYLEPDYGIRLNVKDDRADTRVLNKYDASAVYMPKVSVSPELVSFVSESMRQYMRTMGFNLDADISTDYMMTLSITEYNVGYLSGIGWSGVVRMNVSVYDSNRKLVYPNVSVAGRSNLGGQASNFVTANQALNAAYTNALKDIDWDRIAFFLKKSASPEL